ncbi:hypothetical protein PCANC_17141 [Puccinia coronata f. sp. avenae]|uniref:Uncharacterized protein n=1 Tax=Puccinia coronata f. sp. avenae TaxID=200324 RepID=A0A2N5U1H8_9BASI|nr:hypothetical protein PCANC_17141 [Puccinia coronata f. sp. avenae]
MISNSSTIQGIISPYGSQAPPSPYGSQAPATGSDLGSLTQDASSEKFITPQRAPAAMFICAVNFTIYCAEKRLTKAKKHKIKWFAYKQKKDSLVMFDARRIDWTSFQKLVRIESSKSFSTMLHKIKEGTKATPPTITWGAYILQNEDWPKAAPTSIANNEDFQNWLTAIAKGRAKRGGIALTMENPGLQEKLAHKEAVLAKSVHAATRVALTSATVQSDGNSSCEDYEDIKVYIKMIFDKYAIRDKYESHIPCYPHPTGSERFILLTSDNVGLWAKDLLCCTPGFSIDTPPLLLKYKTCKKRAAPTTAAASIQSDVLDTSQLVAIATAVAQAQITRTTTVAYLDFAGIVEDQDGILRILVSNRIDQYHLFKGPHVTNNQLSRIGLNIGTIAKLRYCVNKYKRHLALMSS